MSLKAYSVNLFETEKEDLYQCALRLLARREHFESEIVRKLRLRGHEASACADVVLRLVSDDLLSNERACEQYVREKVRRGYGPLKILANLREKEVPNALIRRHLDRTTEEWCRELIFLYERRFGPMSSSITLKERRFLIGRGFTGEMIAKALSKS